MQVKWNACYALGNLLYSPYIQQQYFSRSPAWLPAVFSALSNVLRQCTNFKVRINAALALSMVPSLAFYAGHFEEVWQALLEVMETAGSVTVDFAEFKYKETLDMQVRGKLATFCSHWLN